jgi:hypothetical protein
MHTTVVAGWHGSPVLALLTADAIAPAAPIPAIPVLFIEPPAPMPPVPPLLPPVPMSFFVEVTAAG